MVNEERKDGDKSDIFFKCGKPGCALKLDRDGNFIGSLCGVAECRQSEGKAIVFEDGTAYIISRTGWRKVKPTGRKDERGVKKS